MPIKKALLLNFPLGLCIGLISAFGIAAIIDSDVYNELSSEISSVISGVIIILIPTAFATAGVWWNISNQNRLAETIRKRELKSAMISMPSALYEFSILCDKHINYLTNDKYTIPKKSMTLDIRVEEVFKSIIKHKDSSTEEPLNNLLSYYQVCLAGYYYILENSNYGGKYTEVKYHKILRAKSIIRWTGLKALVTAHYSMARNNTSEFILSDARGIFERLLSQTIDINSYYLTNDEIFKNLFTEAIADKNSSFFKPNFFK